jgi:hypothetical protein
MLGQMFEVQGHAPELPTASMRTDEQYWWIDARPLWSAERKFQPFLNVQGGGCYAVLESWLYRRYSEFQSRR